MTPQSTPQSTPAPTVTLNVFGLSDVGKVRKQNEDAFVVADLMQSSRIHEMPAATTLEVGRRGILLAVSDGMGGAEAGEVASALTLHALRGGLRAVEASTAEEALVACVEGANRSVWNAGRDPERRGMGATITAVLLYGRRAYVAEVGDSRAYVLRGRKLVQLTHDQSYVQLMLDKGALTHEQADKFEYRNVILQAIGIQPDVVVALNRFTLRRGDKLLLCSDGLTGKLTPAEICSVVATAVSLEAACRGLVDLANSRGGEDNVTVVLAEVDGEGLPALTGDDRVSLEVVKAFDGEAAGRALG
jgi:serine/threonine protein phosphatase PrpC